jgi:hypothetical protein
MLSTFCTLFDCDDRIIDRLLSNIDDLDEKSEDEMTNYSLSTISSSAELSPYRLKKKRSYDDLCDSVYDDDDDDDDDDNDDDVSESQQRRNKTKDSGSPCGSTNGSIATTKRKHHQQVLRVFIRMISCVIMRISLNMC